MGIVKILMLVPALTDTAFGPGALEELLLILFEKRNNKT